MNGPLIDTLVVKIFIDWNGVKRTTKIQEEIKTFCFLVDDKPSPNTTERV